ncbi:MAG: hypothetical protein EBU33_00650 [Sphingobacteriia bacterium]|nr:hypothetical protein [Sphingobacteriia bacterium]
MSYNGSGTFNINTAGQPVVTGTVISSTAFNALTSDLGTGLSTAITKDGQTTATARIPFAAGINSSLVTDATSTTTGSIITAGGVGIAKALYVGTTLNVAGASTLAAITGTFNGTVGATTPSTGAFTTVTTTTSVAVGGSTLSGSGSGVQFPATQSASTDANTLDDYEEGTYTPTITTTTGSITLNSSYNTLSYIKIGQLVTITGRIRVTSVSLPTGRLLFTIPFNTTAGTQESGRGQCFGVGVESATVSMNSYMIDWAPSSSTIEIALLVGASYTNAAPNITASSLFSFAFSYRCTA